MKTLVATLLLLLVAEFQAGPAPQAGPRVEAARRTMEYHTVDMRTMRPADEAGDALLLIDLAGITVEEFQKLKMWLVVLMPALQSASVSSFEPEYLVPGRTVTINVQLRGGGELHGLECTPGIGLTMASPREMPANLSQKSANVRLWQIDVTAATDAAPGPRSCTVVAATGRARSREIKILDHAPEITDLKVVKAVPVNGVFTFEAIIHDSKGDVSVGNSLLCTLLTDTNDLFGMSTNWAEAVKPLGAARYRVTSSGKLVADHLPARNIQGTFTLRCALTDDAGGRSNQATATIVFGK